MSSAVEHINVAICYMTCIVTSTSSAKVRYELSMRQRSCGNVHGDSNMLNVGFVICREAHLASGADMSAVASEA